MVQSARQTALEVLTRIRRGGERPDILLRELTAPLSPQETALAMRLCWTAIQQAPLIDHVLGGYVSLRKTHPRILDILRLGAVQIWYTDRIPLYAIVNESAALARKTAPHAAGLVNAVLRKLPSAPPETDDLCLRYGLPPWLLRRLSPHMSHEEIEGFFAASNHLPPLYFCANPFAPQPLPAETRPHPVLPGFHILDNPRALSALCQQGLGLVADPAAGLCVAALNPQPGMRVWDCCAAPGGKSVMTAFVMKNRGEIIATDIRNDKLPAIRESAACQRIDILRTAPMDARTARPEGLFDAVLCDVPCSGLGVLRKKPDIRQKREEDIAPLPEIQRAILENGAKAVKPGGCLVYATCTVLPEENEAVVAAFLSQNSDFAPDSFTLPLAGDCPEGMVQLWPHKHDTDGFFICRMKRKAP